MARINLEHLIMEVLEREMNKGNQFLSAGEIAFRCTGVCYEKGIMRKSSIVGHSIKTRMPAVRQNALKEGRVITSKRVKHLEERDKRGNKVREKSLEVFGWKIADKDDKTFILEDMEIRRLLSNGNLEKLKVIEETAKERGLISPKDLPALLEGN